MSQQGEGMMRMRLPYTLAVRFPSWLQALASRVGQGLRPSLSSNRGGTNRAATPTWGVKTWV